MDFVTIRSFDNYVEAHIVMGSLQEENINCWLKDEYTVTIDPLLTNAVGGIKLMVAEAQAIRAIELLRQAQEQKEQHYVCPYCNSHDIKRITASQKKMGLFSILISWLSGSRIVNEEQAWHCTACGTAFKQPVEIAEE